MLRLVALAACVLAFACGDDATGLRADATAGDDAKVTRDSAPATDAPIHPLAGFGDLSGDCNVLDDELTATSPSELASAIEFAWMYTAADQPSLSAGSQKIIADDNAGGSSLYSEVFAYELLYRCEDASLIKTETEISYDVAGPITDLLVSIDGLKIGVSVTRAVGFPFDDPYTVDQATTLLQGKLDDILASSANVSAADSWRKQILVVVAYAPGHADALATALADIAPQTRADTIVWVMVSNGPDDFLYCDGPCQ